MRRLSATRPEAIRRHNLSVVLQEIHHDGALTRAELTARLGMSRSTIGALVAELVELEVLYESVPTGGSRAGRPSHLVGPHERGPFVIAADVDVTHVVVAAVGLGGTVLARRRIETAGRPLTPEQTAQVIVEAAAELAEESGSRVGPTAIGVSVPGTVDPRSGRVGFAPNLEWRDADLGDFICAQLKSRGLDTVPVMVGNDANLAMLAEHVRGSARDVPDAVFLIGRIGVGAGIMANGLPLYGPDGHAGEIGHNVVDPGGPPCHCGKFGCLETYVGAAALVSAAGIPGVATEDHVDAVLAAAHEGEAAAIKAVTSVARELGRGLAMIVNTLNPQLVVLGGTLADVFDVAAAELWDSLRHYALTPPFKTLRLLQPYLGTDSALIGAAEVAFAPLLADPSGWRERYQPQPA